MKGRENASFSFVGIVISCFLLLLSIFEHESFVQPKEVTIYNSADKVKADPDKEGKVLNLTQHDASPGHVAAGVVEPADKTAIRAELTFVGGATADDIKSKAEAIADKAVAEGCTKAMIGGAPYLMSALETALSARGIEPVYSFSESNVVTKENPDGSVSRKVEFEHKGFVEVSPFAPADVAKDEKDGIDKDEDSIDRDTDTGEENDDLENSDDSVDADGNLDDENYDLDENDVDFENDDTDYDDDSWGDDCSSDW